MYIYDNQLYALVTVLTNIIYYSYM